tara:strand:+ start:255 stop:1157 length:903 start_codon:yes stop_codon:yes gene_type:complete
MLIVFSCSKLYGEDSLTIKQQLDRITEEIKDLNKAVFNKSFDKNEISSEESIIDTERFTSIDIRIYDLEKDIKKLTLQFEEIFFKLDDISSKIITLETDIISKFQILENEYTNLTFNQKNDLNNNETKNIKEENTLGELVISNDDQSTSKIQSKNKKEENLIKSQEQNLENLNPEELLQYALDQMMKKNYNNSKKILENFLLKFPENQLSGSAHFWLGKIYLFESDYRKAAIIFGEGVQKFPKSIKAAEMYYELTKSLKEMNKIPEACRTFELLEKNYKGNKYTTDPEKIKDTLNCTSIE